MNRTPAGLLSSLKLRGIRTIGAATAASLRLRPPAKYRAGLTVVTVNWNSMYFLGPMLDVVESMSPKGTEILVVDNASTDGSREFLRERAGVGSLELPVNVGHGLALDLAIPRIDTEFVAVLDVDAFPVSPRWIEASISALDAGPRIAGARLHRNFVHPSFLVTRTKLLHELGLTFRPVGYMKRVGKPAPLFMDVGEALSQRAIIKFHGTSSALHFFEPTSVRGPGLAGAVFGNLVYHNLYATQGRGHSDARVMFDAALAEHHPEIATVWRRNAHLGADD
ncbi:glycosyltransferase [Knoellia sp. S7-12]|uniref:glycosyltransferase n=1 Tax=Knoellia sp. S7-12 TaxID=3126698 RepID=UPI003368DC15